MKKILLITLLIVVNSFTHIYAIEIECKKFDLGCKANKYIQKTKEFQKKGLEQSSKQLKETIKKIPSIPKK
jgi:UTP-glucose-1-phosphate uridylyltransferase